MLYPRNPALVHLVVDSEQRSFKVVVVGSSVDGDENLWKKVEVFDPSTSAWTEASELPRPEFGLYEIQAGVCFNGKLFVIVYLEGYCLRGVVAFDVEKGKWLMDLLCPILFSSRARTVQLVESDGKVYLCTQVDLNCGRYVELCIDELDFPDPDAGGALRNHWRNVVRVKISGGRGRRLFPVFSCMAVGKGKLCIFNFDNRTGVVHEMQEGKPCDELQAPPADRISKNFFSMNLSSFTLQPIFAKPLREC